MTVPVHSLFGVKKYLSFLDRRESRVRRCFLVVLKMTMRGALKLRALVSYEKRKKKVTTTSSSRRLLLSLSLS